MSQDANGIYHDDALQAAREHSPRLSRFGIGGMHETRRGLRSVIKASPLSEQLWLGQELARHYSVATATFTNSFVLGLHADCSPAEYAIAGGFSNAVFERARADVTSGRVDRPKPPRKAVSISAQRAQMESWVRQERAKMKGRPEDGDVLTAKKSIAARYRDYAKMASDELHQTKDMYGAEDLFASVWKGHHEIHEKKLNDHDDCSTCIDIRTAKEGDCTAFAHDLPSALLPPSRICHACRPGWQARRAVTAGSRPANG